MSSKIDITDLKIKTSKSRGRSRSPKSKKSRSPQPKSRSPQPKSRPPHPKSRSPSRSKKDSPYSRYNKDESSGSDEEDEEWIDLGKGDLSIEVDNYNSKFTDILSLLLEQMINDNKVESDTKLKRVNQFRIKAMKDGIQALKDHPSEITSGHDAQQIKGIGKGIAERIDEIIETETLKELDTTVTEESEAVTSLTTIKGIGDKHALDFYHKYKITSAKQLYDLWKKGEDRKMGIGLTHEMQIGLKYYDDFLLKVPYDEIELVRQIFEPILAEIDPNLRYEICGSHRREKAFSGDIDILITHTKINTMEDMKKSDKNYLGELIDSLLESGFLIDEMLLKPGQLFRGVCKLKEHARQVDFHMVSWESWPTALLHFTGSKIFNVQMRRVALRKGYTLTEFGLYKLTNGKKDGIVPVKSERDVFKALKVKYLDPKNREFGK